MRELPEELPLRRDPHGREAAAEAATERMTIPVAVLLFGFLGFIALRYIPEWQPLHTALYLGYAAVIFLFLFGLTKRRGIERPL